VQVQMVVKMIWMVLLRLQLLPRQQQSLLLRMET
jgi:hypothetical protein